MNSAVKVVAGIVAAVVISVACFYGGTVYGKGQSQTASTAAARGQAGGPPAGQFGPGGGQGNGAGGLLVGQVQEIGNGVMTVVDNSGKQTQVKVTNTTLIQKQASIDLTDLQKGDTVMVSGSKGTDGSLTARSVQVGVPGGFAAQDSAVPTQVVPFGANPGGQFPGGPNPPTGAPAGGTRP